MASCSSAGEPVLVRGTPGRALEAAGQAREGALTGVAWSCEVRPASRAAGRAALRQVPDRGAGRRGPSAVLPVCRVGRTRQAAAGVLPGRRSPVRGASLLVVRRPCFLATVEHRFRGAFGKAHVVLKDERVVLAVTGGGASRCERGGVWRREAAWGGPDLPASDLLARPRGPQGAGRADAAKRAQRAAGPPVRGDRDCRPRRRVRRDFLPGTQAVLAARAGPQRHA